MTCAELESWIAAYADGELEARRGEIVEEHLAQCAACGKLLAEFTALASALRDGLEIVEAPARLHARVMAALPEPEFAGRRRGSVMPPRGWFAFFGLAPAAALALWLLASPPAPIAEGTTPGAGEKRTVLDAPHQEAVPQHQAASGSKPEATSAKPEAKSQEGVASRPSAPAHSRPAAAGGSSRSTTRKQSGKAGTSRGKSPRRPAIVPDTNGSPEPHSLRRLKQLRPRRYHEFLVEAPRRRTPGRRLGRVLQVADDAWRRPMGAQRARSKNVRLAVSDADTRDSRPRVTPHSPDLTPQITVVDYVLPQVQPQPGPSEFLNANDPHAADGVQVTQAVFEF
jgi:anti-sigma factor RsiW